MIVNLNSWHFWVLRKTIGEYRANNIQDSCEYIRAVIWGSLILVIVWSLLSVLSVAFIVLIFSMIYFFVSLFGFISVLDVDFWATGVVTTGIFVVIGCRILWDKYEFRIKRFFRGRKKHNAKTNAPKSPEFFAQVKDRIKNKFCSKVELIDTMD